MDKDLLIKVGVELLGVLIRSGLEFARTLGVPDAELEKAFQTAKVEFTKNNPANLPKFN